MLKALGGILAFGIVIVGSISYGAVALSFEDVIAAQPDRVEISPVRWDGLKVDVLPAEACIMAGYQWAIESEKEPIAKGQAYISVNGSGWGGSHSC